MVPALNTDKDADSRDRRVSLELVQGLARSLAPMGMRAEAALFGDEPPALPPLFILGLPRAGTTLAMQVVCHCLSVSYLPEISRYFPPLPACAAWLMPKNARRPQATFESNYGTSAGWFAPSEGLFWNLWLERDRFYDTPSDVRADAARAIVGTVGRIERIGGGAFVNKNLRNNNRVGLLGSLFPSAKFLVVVRDPARVAHSLLRGRREVAGGVDRWFSIKPRNFESVCTGSPAAQVAGQIEGLLRDLGQDARRVGPSRFALVSYEALCRDPKAFVEDLIRFLDPRDGAFARRADPPAGFRSSAGSRTDLDDVSREAARLLEERLPKDPYEPLEGRWLAE